MGPDHFLPGGAERRPQRLWFCSSRAEIQCTPEKLERNQHFCLDEAAAWRWRPMSGGGGQRTPPGWPNQGRSWTCRNQEEERTGHGKRAGEKQGQRIRQGCRMPIREPSQKPESSQGKKLSELTEGSEPCRVPSLPSSNRTCFLPWIPFKKAAPTRVDGIEWTWTLGLEDPENGTLNNDKRERASCRTWDHR